MKKHGSATKRAFDELMSKSDAGAHRIGKDQNRQDITGLTSASAPKRRSGNIETLSREVPSREIPSREVSSREQSSHGPVSRDKRPREAVPPTAPTAAVRRETSAPVGAESPVRLGADASLRSAASPAKPIADASRRAAVRSVSENAGVSSVQKMKSATPAKARTDQRPAQTAPMRGAAPVAKSAPGKQAPLRREEVPVRADAQPRAAAPVRPADISDLQPHRDFAPAAHTASPAKRRPRGKSVVKRAAMGAVAALAVIGVAVTVYAITSDKNEPASPDVFIGGGSAKISDSLSSASVISTKNISDETGAQSDVSETLSPAPAEKEEADKDANADAAQSAQRIDSRFTVTFKFYQEESIVCSTPETTVGALMERLGITAGDGKRMYVSSDDIINADTEIRIDTVEYKTEYGTEAVAYTTEYQDVRTIPRGSTKLYRSGKNGVKTVEYFCEYVNGELTNKETRGESITTAPTTQIMYRGVGGTIGGRSYSYYIDVKATTYTGGGTTASGLPANESVIAVDPSVIPLGTKVYVTGSYGDFGVRTAADTGGSIKGNKIDIYLESSNPYFGNFGWRNMRVYILG